MNLSDLRAEIAATAARLIADEGADYATAKRKAARMVLGGRSVPGEYMPDNMAIEAALREHLELFEGEAHAERLQALRERALLWMRRLAAFRPHVTGAVLRGTATEHSDIHLHLFCDSAKDVELFLLEANQPFEVGEGRHFRGKDPVEQIGIEDDGFWIELSLYATDDLRGALLPDESGQAVRADQRTLEALMQESRP